MPTPNSSTFRNAFFPGVLSRIQAEMTVLQAAVEGKETTTYSSGNFADIVEKFDDVRTALDEIQTLNSDIGNP